jgi:hypothetical protein
MHKDDIRTITKKRTGTSYVLTLDEEMLGYLGFGEKEIASEEIVIVLQADFSKKHGQPFIGIAKKK